MVFLASICATFISAVRTTYIGKFENTLVRVRLSSQTLIILLKEATYLR